MPIVATVGRRSRPVATFLVMAYILLTLGAVSMVVPFLIMLTSAVANGWDYPAFHLYPTYLVDRRERYMKFLVEKYLDVNQARVSIARDFRLFSAAYQPPADWGSFRAMQEDKQFRERPLFCFGTEQGREAQLRRLHQDYLLWLESGDDPLLALPMFARLTRVRYQETIRRFYEDEVLQARNLRRGDLPAAALEQAALDRLAEQWREAKFKRFFYLEMMTEGSYPYHLRAWLPSSDNRRGQDYLRFVRSLPADWKTPITARHLWLRYLENAAGDLAAFNRATGLNVDSYARVPFPDEEPANPRLRELWRSFVHEKWPLWLIRLPADGAPEYREFLGRRCGSLEKFNRAVQATYATWADVPFTGRTPARALECNFWREFLLQLPPGQLAAHRYYPELSYRDFLRRTYGDVATLNTAYGWNVAAFADVQIPVAEADYAQFLAEERGWVKTFLTFNFTQVFNYMTVQGRAVLNTFLLVVLSILTCLTVNPLAAYALSRFRLRSTQQILIFLLATMAFPAEISMIPNFLLLRELGLLNTFAALLLPGLASGFGIFLLKGFFDSLPQELYEAATLDGASEAVMFTRITLPLCKPILAYQALMAFMGAYGGFMWAFLVCQEPDMWTIMVWIYQYQQNASAFPYMIMAAFVLASIPTLVVFLWCQKIILRGIIIPSMK